MWIPSASTCTGWWTRVLSEAAAAALTVSQCCQVFTRNREDRSRSRRWADRGSTSSQLSGLLERLALSRQFKNKRTNLAKRKDYSQNLQPTCCLSQLMSALPKDLTFLNGTTQRWFTRLLILTGRSTGKIKASTTSTGRSMEMITILLLPGCSMKL